MCISMYFSISCDFNSRVYLDEAIGGTCRVSFQGRLRSNHWASHDGGLRRLVDALTVPTPLYTKPSQKHQKSIQKTQEHFSGSIAHISIQLKSSQIDKSSTLQYTSYFIDTLSQVLKAFPCIRSWSRYEPCGLPQMYAQQCPASMFSESTAMCRGLELLAMACNLLNSYDILWPLIIFF